MLLRPSVGSQRPGLRRAVELAPKGAVRARKRPKASEPSGWPTLDLARASWVAYRHEEHSQTEKGRSRPQDRQTHEEPACCHRWSLSRRAQSPRQIFQQHAEHAGHPIQTRWLLLLRFLRERAGPWRHPSEPTISRPLGRHSDGEHTSAGENEHSCCFSEVASTHSTPLPRRAVKQAQNHTLDPAWTDR